MAMLRRLLVLALLVGVMVGGWKFAAANSGPVAIDLVFHRLEGLPLWLVLLSTFGGGVGLTALYSIYALTRAKLVARRYRKAVSGLESEVHQLRNLPLASEERFDEAPGALDAVSERSA